MKRRIAISAIVLTLLGASAAHAKNYCATWGSAHVDAVGLLPLKKGTCKSFNGFLENAPLLLAGDACASSDGTTILFNTFAQLGVNGADSIAGSFSASTGSGSGNECFGGSCFAFTVTMVTCPKPLPVPAVATTQSQLSDSVTQQRR